MPDVVIAEGAILQRVLETSHSISGKGLSPYAYAQFEAAQTKTAWGRRHRRRRALVEGKDVLASATECDVAAVLDQRPLRACALGSVVSGRTHSDDTHTQELVAQILEQAARDGAAMALLFADVDAHYARANGFNAVPIIETELTVAESARPGAPMTLIRGGEERDLAAIVAMGQVRTSPFRFHLDRNVEFVQHAITTKRLLAGLGTAGARQLHFFIAEEGITAAAYIVISIVDRTWTIEECGDRDPSGARVGAILQALIAREPVERRPRIHAWLPPGFVPPQVAIASAKPATQVTMMRSLGTTEVLPQLSAVDVLYWRSDIF